MNDPTTLSEIEHPRSDLPSGSLDRALIEQALGLSVSTYPSGVVGCQLPRHDLHVRVLNVRLQPAFALNSWFAFRETPDGGLLMGDLALAEDEVMPVMRRLRQGGIELLALHNHLIGERPGVIFLHLAGRGEPVRMAEALHTALALTHTSLTEVPEWSSDEPLPLDMEEIDRILGHDGELMEGYYQITLPRPERILYRGVELPVEMGTATTLKFQPTEEGMAAVTGQFVLLPGEVNGVIDALLEQDIHVTALHNHMLADEPRLDILHFWAHENALDLARGLRAAIARAGATP